MDALISEESAVAVRLEHQTVTCNGKVFHFEIDPFAKHSMLNGLDELGYTLSRLNEIRYEMSLEEMPTKSLRES
jgi:3-isopropylmalate/(R)-2-methylmalate dehydratase small subunit